MAVSVNKVIIVGNLGKDPEVRYLESGVGVANFPVATSESYKDRNTGEKVTQTEWHNVVMWRGLADVADKYLKKGHQVYIEGKLKTRNWQDKDGNTRYTTEIVADNMVMMSKPVASQSDEQIVQPVATEQPSASQPVAATGGQPQVSDPGQDFSSDKTDDLPF